MVKKCSMHKKKEKQLASKKTYKNSSTQILLALFLLLFCFEILKDISKFQIQNA